METADRKTRARCPRCDTPLSDSVLGGQCPVCVVNLARRIAAERDNAVHFPNPSGGMTHVDTEALRYFGEFELLGEVGRGGMGVVYKACQLRLNRVVALKLIAPEQLASPKYVERFHTEAEAAANLDHPNIVPIYDTGTFEGRHYFSMRLIEGQSLAQCIGDFRLPVVDSKSRLTTALRSQIVNRQSEIANLLATVADAVHFAHQRGILHRDLKPGNILIDPAGQPHVTDFGLAKRVEDDSSLTLSGEVLGTPAYMAPEQAAGKTREMTTATDIYSLGAILYELLTGRPPFQTATSVETLHALLHEEAVAPRSLNHIVPSDLETICLKCLQKESSRRYTSARALAEDLRLFARGEPIQARPATQTEKVWRWCRRKPALAASLALSHLVVLLGLSGILWQWHNARQEALIAQRNLYAADIGAAQRALEQDNLRQATDLLHKHIPKSGEPDLRGFEWRYLWQQCQSEELFSLAGHAKTVTSLAFSPDGRQLVTGSFDRTAKVWDLATRRVIATLTGHSDEVGSVCFSPKGDLIATGSQGALRVWETKGFRPVQVFLKPAVKVRFSPDGRYLAAAGTNVILWNTRTWQVANNIELPPLQDYSTPGEYLPDSNGFGLAFSPDGRYLAVVLKDGVQLFTVPDFQIAKQLKDRMPRARFVTFGPDSRTLATSTFGHEVKLWDVESATDLHVLAGHSDTIDGAAFSPDGKRLATASLDQTVKLWDVATGALLRTFRGHTEEVWEVAFSPDGKLLASVSKDGAVKFWDPLTDPKQAPDLSSYLPLGFGLEGNLVGFARNGGLTRYNSESLQKISDLEFRGRPGAHQFFIDLGNLSKDGRTMALPVLGNKAEAEIWDLQRRQFICSVENLIGRVVFAPQEDLLATGTSNNNVTVWQLPEGVRRGVLTNTCAPVAFSPDARMLVTASENGKELKLWRIAPEHRAFPTKLIRSFDDGIDANSHNATFSPDGRTLVYAAWGGFLRLYDLRSGQECATLIGHKRDVSGMSFSPDGRTLATISDDGTARLWDVATSRELMRFHTPMIDPEGPELMFSPDGRALLTVANESQRAVTRVWFAPSLGEIAVAEGKDYRSVVHSPMDWFAVGLALERRSRFPEALEAFTEAIHEANGHPSLDDLLDSAHLRRGKLLFGLGRYTAAGVDDTAGQHLPVRDLRAGERLLDLSPFFNRSLDSESPSIPPMGYFPTLPRGVNTLPGTGRTEFDLRGVVRVGSGARERGDPAAVTDIRVRQKSRRLHFLQSAHFRESEDIPVGAYVIHYTDGNREEIPIQYGRHVRDWVLSVDPGDLTDAKVAWTGTHPSKGAIRIFEQTWENPRPEVEIQSLDFVSKLTKCSPFLIAITAEP